MENGLLKLFTKAEIANRLDISERQLSKIASDGKIGYHKVGAKKLFTEIQFQEYIESISIKPKHDELDVEHGYTHD